MLLCCGIANAKQPSSNTPEIAETWAKSGLQGQPLILCPQASIPQSLHPQSLPPLNNRSSPTHAQHRVTSPLHNLMT
jgi:hypothetical protein